MDTLEDLRQRNKELGNALREIREERDAMVWRTQRMRSLYFDMKTLADDVVAGRITPEKYAEEMGKHQFPTDTAYRTELLACYASIEILADIVEACRWVGTKIEQGACRDNVHAIARDFIRDRTADAQKNTCASVALSRASRHTKVFGARLALAEQLRVCRTTVTPWYTRLWLWLVG